MNVLKNLGYYNSNLEVLINNQKNNLIDLTYKIKGKKQLKKSLLLEIKFLKIEN